VTIALPDTRARGPAPCPPEREVILVVDDDLDSRDAVCELLEDEGYAVATAGDGVEALEWLRAAAQAPGLILLDLVMPRMSGRDFLDELRRDPRLAQPPIIALSAAPEPYCRIEAPRCDAYALKTSPFEDLLRLVRLCLGR
jgi:CheY-like chemotaxis protein